MLKKDDSFKTRYKHWKRWRIMNTNSVIYQVAVLFKIVNSPSFDGMFLPTYKRS